MKTAIEKRMMNYQTDSFGIVHHARYLEIFEYFLISKTRFLSEVFILLVASLEEKRK